MRDDCRWTHKTSEKPNTGSDLSSEVCSSLNVDKDSDEIRVRVFFQEFDLVCSRSGPLSYLGSSDPGWAKDNSPRSHQGS